MGKSVARTHIHALSWGKSSQYTGP